MSRVRERLPDVAIVLGLVFTVVAVLGLVVAEGDPQATEDPQAFLELLEQAHAEEDATTLLKRLHPVVVELYGEAQCRDHVAQLVARPPGPEQEVAAVDGPGPWTFGEHEGLAVPVEDVLSVEVVQRGSPEGERELHLGLVDGRLHWFTDCGDPREASRSDDRR